MRAARTVQPPTLPLPTAVSSLSFSCSGSRAVCPALFRLAVFSGRRPHAPSSSRYRSAARGTATPGRPSRMELVDQEKHTGSGLGGQGTIFNMRSDTLMLQMGVLATRRGWACPGQPVFGPLGSAERCWRRSSSAAVSSCCRRFCLRCCVPARACCCLLGIPIEGRWCVNGLPQKGRPALPSRSFRHCRTCGRLQRPVHASRRPGDAALL